MTNNTVYKIAVNEEVLQAHHTAIAILANHCPQSKTFLKQAMQQGAVWLQRGKSTQRLRRASKSLSAGDYLYFYYNPKVLNTECPSAHLIADENLYSVWLKPCGMLSQGSKWSDHCTITRWAERQLLPQRNAFLVHRLDRATTGVTLVAHSKAAVRQLSQLFASRQINKIYRSSVKGQWPHENTIMINDPIAGKPACSLVKPLGYDSQTDESLLEIKLETGRKHQIRIHLSQAGFAIIGDRLYGESDNFKNNTINSDLQLLAYQLSFTCPFTGEIKTYTAPFSLPV